MDLPRYYRDDPANQWFGRLPLRRLAVRLRYLQHDSAVIATYGDPAATWSRTDILLTDVFHAVAGNPHPARPRPQTKPHSATELRDRERLMRERQARRKAELEQLNRG